jgi:hypothetical protein
MDFHVAPSSFIGGSFRFPHGQISDWIHCFRVLRRFPCPLWEKVQLLLSDGCEAKVGDTKEPANTSAVQCIVRPIFHEIHAKDQILIGIADDMTAMPRLSFRLLARLSSNITRKSPILNWHRLSLRSKIMDDICAGGICQRSDWNEKSSN